MLHLADLRLQNFRSFHDAEFKFPPRGLMLIRGHDTETGESSGTGKTAIFFGIAYLLDILPSEVSATVLQNWDTEEDLQVTGTFMDGDQKIVLARGKKTYVERNGKKKTGAKSYIEELKAIFGVSSEVLRALTYRPQDSNGFFLGMRPAEKIEFLTGVLGLGAVEVAVDEASKRVTNREDTLPNIRSQLDTYAQNLTAEKAVPVPDEVDVQALTKEVARAEDVRDTAMSAREEAEVKVRELEQSERDDRRVEVEAKKAELDKARMYRATVQKELDAKLKLVRDEAAEVRTKLRPIDASLAKCDLQDRDLAAICRSIRSYLDSKCPTCDQSWVQEKARLEDLEKQEKVLAAEVDIRPARRAQKLALETRLRELDATPVTDSRLERLAAVERKLTAEMAVLTEVQPSAALVDAAVHLSDLKAAEQKAALALNTADNAVKAARSRNELRAQVLKDREARLTKARELVKQVEDKLRMTETELALEKDFVAAMGREGFLGVIFDDILQEIAADANQRFARLANVRDVTLEFVTETANGRRQIQTFVNVRKGRGTVRSICSGGMATSIEQVVDLAVIAVISRRVGGRLPAWLCLDEVTNGQGPVTKEAALEVLREAARDRLVLVIDHGTEFKESFESAVDIEFTNGVSRVK